MRFALPVALLLAGGDALAYVPVMDAWNEGIYVVDGDRVCASWSVNEDDQALCDQIRNLYGFGGNVNDLLNYSLGGIYDAGDMGGDYVDTLIIMSDFDQQLGDALAFYSGVCNEIRGTGQFTDGCARTLSGIIDMNASDKFPADYNAGYSGYFSFFDVLGQEVEHQVGAFLRAPGALDLIGRQGSHWSFFMQTDGSVMEGNKWRDEGNGTFTTVDPDGGFHGIDQYLWGFRPPEEVEPMFVVLPAAWSSSADGPYPIDPPTVKGTDAQDCSLDSECPRGTYVQVCVRPKCESDVDCEDGSVCVEGSYGLECDDLDGATADGSCQYEVNDWLFARTGTVVRGTRGDFTIADLMEENGARDPDFFDAPKYTREWFLWFTRPGEVPPETAACLEGRFDRLIRMRIEWEKYFYEQTDFRGRVLTSEDLVEDLPLWEWGLVSTGYTGGTLPAEDALERWTFGGAHATNPDVRARDPMSCATDLDCDEGQRCIRRACQGSDRYLHVESGGGDAYIDSPLMRFHANAYNTFAITMNANQGGTVGTLQWKTDGDTDFTEDKSLRFSISGDGTRRIHKLLLQEEDGWSGDVTGLRIFPGDGAGSFDIDRVELTKEEIQMYCVGPEDGSCGGCGPGLQCRGGACVPPIPCAPRSCVMPPSATPCIPGCEAGWSCVDGACQIPKACNEACECGDDAATCEALDVCPSGWTCDVTVPDRDGDGFLDEEDNCRDLANPEQRDADHDGIGDDCQDLDGDGVVNAEDNCPSVTNSRQGNADDDELGDVCDPDFEYDVGCTCRLAGDRRANPPVLVLVLVLVSVLVRRRR